jgi:hypothetical protein
MKELHYLVINNNKNGLYSFSEQFQIFAKRADAIKHFVEIGGYEIHDGMRLSNKCGQASIQRSGLIDLTFLPLLLQ